MRRCHPRIAIFLFGSFLFTGQGLAASGAIECPADLDGGGDVDAADLAQLLSDWGPYGPCPPFIATDFDEDCEVDAADLAELLSAWGSCPE